MPQKVAYDAVVVGAGPNGLAAAIRMAEAGHAVLLLEGAGTVGGSCRSAELTLPGFVHDVCSAIHPLGAGSPFFRKLALEHHGLAWAHPDYPLAHALDDGRAAVLKRDLGETATGLGADAEAYRRLFGPLARDWEMLSAEFLQPLLHWPSHPLKFARFGRQALRSAEGLARKTFSTEAGRALFGGLAAHSFLPLDAAGSGAFGLVLGMLGHAVGWPLPRGGAQHIPNALLAHFLSLGGEVATHARVTSIDQLPLARALLMDVTPRQLLRLAGNKLPGWYARRLEQYRYGPGVFKLDYALTEPIPWAAPQCRRAGTVHVGGSLDEVCASEREVAAGRAAGRPFVLLAQPTVFDPTRAPEGKHTAWAYCHAPNGSTLDLTDRVEQQIERFAPGFRDCILARRAWNCHDVEANNPNLVGGDINGGAADLKQMLARPVFSRWPYRTPVPGLYLCSASTPPGGGVHGMCGWHAAGIALKDCFQ